MTAFLTVADSPSPERLPRARVALAFLVLLLALLAPLAPLPAEASVSAAERADSGGDFPSLPSRCQSIAQQLPLTPCHVTRFGSRRPVVVLWGDSHAQQYLPALVKVARRDRVNLVAILAGGCPATFPKPRPDGEHPDTTCETRQGLAVSWIERAFGRHDGHFKLIIGTFYARYRQIYRRMHDPRRRFTYSAYEKQLVRLQHRDTSRLFTELGRVGVPTDVIGEDATVPNPVPACDAGIEPYQCDLPRAQALDREQQNRRWLLGLMSRLPGSPRLIDTTPAMCDASTCYAHVNGIDTYFDDLHLGARLTSTLGRFFVPSFVDVL